MVDRQEVEALLADATHPHSYMERVPADTLAALCRAWLALEDGVQVQWSRGGGAAAAHLYGQRVRIVKEVGDD